MKKLSVLLVALVAVFAISCTKSATAEIIKLVEDTTAKVEKCENAEDFAKIQEEFQGKYAQLLDKVDVTKVTDEESKAMDAALEKLNAAGAKFETEEPAEEPAEGEAVEGEEPAKEEAAQAEEPKAEEEAAQAEEGEAAPAEAK